MIHELEGTLARVLRFVPEFSTPVGELESGWFPAADLGDPTRDRLADALERMAVSYPGADKRTQAALFINQYAWVLSGTAVITFLQEKRVLDFALNNVALRYNTVTWEENGESRQYERLEVRVLMHEISITLSIHIFQI